MTLVLVGLDYRHTPLALRERLYLSGEALTQTLTALHSDVLTECVIVSTCNRLEVYATTSDVNAAVDAILEMLTARAQTPIHGYAHVVCDGDVVRHLMRVASGLESLVMGETEILGQITRALQAARQAQTIGAVLSRLFHDGLHAGKRARSETAISQHTLSVSHAAVRMAKRQMGDLSKARVLIMGAGRMAELAIWALKAQDVTDIQIINRSDANARILATRFGLQARPWSQLETAVSQADVVIAATSASQPILNASMFAQTSQKRILIDISVPRNIDQDVRTLPNVCLYDVDDLQMVVEDHRAKRQSEVTRVEAILQDEWSAYMTWLNSRRAIPAITALRQQTESMAAEELTRALQRMPDLSEQERAVMSQMVHRLVNKVLHGPTVALRDQAAQLNELETESRFSLLHDEVAS